MVQEKTWTATVTAQGGWMSRRGGAMSSGRETGQRTPRGGGNNAVGKTRGRGDQWRGDQSKGKWIGGASTTDNREFKLRYVDKKPP